jgi:hypothetical protein
MPPTEPLAFEAISGPGMGELTLRWMPPASTGGGHLLAYRVYDLDNNLLAELGPAEQEYHVWDVPNGEARTHYVTAVNQYGESSSSNRAAASAIVPPQGVAGLSAEVGQMGDITLTWTAPAGWGSSQASHYLVHKTVLSADEAVLLTPPGTVLSAAASAVLPAPEADEAHWVATVSSPAYVDRTCASGTVCIYRVFAVNAQGAAGLPSEPFGLAGSVLPDAAAALSKLAATLGVDPNPTAVLPIPGAPVAPSNLGGPVSLADPNPSPPYPECEDPTLQLVEGVGMACRTGASNVWRVTLADGRYVFTHGGDPEPTSSGGSFATAATTASTTSSTSSSTPCDTNNQCWVQGKKAWLCVENPATDYHIKVIYAYANDDTNAFSSREATIRSSLEYANGLVREHGAAMNRVVDLRTECDATGKVAIAQHKLTSVTKATDDYGKIVDALKALGYPDANTHRKYLVYYDDDSHCGVGGMQIDSTLKLENRNNHGGLFAVVWGDPAPGKTDCFHPGSATDQH